MAGINLSQSGEERRSSSKKKMFDAGFIIVVIVFVLVLGVWGALWYFSQSAEGEIQALDAQINAATTELTGDEVDRILGFDARVKGIEENVPLHLDTAERFAQLEKMILPSIRLTNFSYDHQKGATVIEGVTNDYKFLAQQLISLKTDPMYQNIRVDAVTTTETGDISFTLKSESLPQEL